ncbi:MULTISPECIES: RsfA family transcriptional regulator [Pontibacillus]|uniref:RsfA family transcriptional regulator n=1 Tax=Pontibacillus chungwhensis TaxID=265426 RepID=A0ABY8V307_9BACI|nr:MULTISPECIES: RsfA family transcriptional regulator [Pontibacillus]MCD5322578.1 RsfA family transcriptional regulator [Pontibacillus sp. HN14]WIF99863.1 RsfA family transcriptional regulator [Pontibacillus chungwhensis]
MNATRQDAWTQDEDVLLAETVLRYIRLGKTQLEAFEEVARKLSRTSAACGFRWNATVRKRYSKGIQLAKEERKRGGVGKEEVASAEESIASAFSIDDAISFLETMRQNVSGAKPEPHKQELSQLYEENQKLKDQVKRYHQAWEEMGKLWQWVQIPKEKG